MLTCPSDLIPQNPAPAVKHPPGTYLWGITSYGGNGGTQSYPNATLDGMFFAVGPGASPPAAPVRMLEHHGWIEQHLAIRGTKPRGQQL